MPAAAVIPAPRAYTNIAAVKTLVVGFWVMGLSGGRIGWVGAARGSPRSTWGVRVPARGSVWLPGINP